MNIFDIYFSPTNYFNKLKEKPQWLIPMICIVVIAILMTVITLISFGPEKRIAQLKDQNMPAEQLEKAEQFMKSPLSNVISIATVIIYIPITLLLVSLIFHFILPLIGAAGKYMMTFSIIAGAGLIRIPQMIVKMILTLIKGTPYVHTSFALFTPMLSKNTFIFRFLSKLDFFTIWEIALIALGLQTIYMIKDKKSYYLVFGLWLLYIIVTSIFAGRAMPKS